jgi:pimeloyl-ACP methyl ester carboxylesterase
MPEALSYANFQFLSETIQRSAGLPQGATGTVTALLARADELRGQAPQPTGKRVILLPGILGNALEDGGIFPLWLNLGRLFWPGGLERLKVRPGATYRDDVNLASGFEINAGPLLPEAYEPISLWLGAHGFVVERFPFDWRMSIDRAADALRDVLMKPGALPTQVVGHSMGCLVVRRCVQKYPDLIRDEKIERAVFIAPPFRGSFVPVQAAAEQYWATDLLALVGMDHGRVRQTFCTFPGFAEMIADPTEFVESSAVLDPASWPLTNFSDTLLRRATKFAQDLRAPDDQPARDADLALMKRSMIVLCTSRDTVTRATRSGQTTRFEAVAHGDDTVPTASAWNKDARVYEAFWTHSLIPAEPAVFAGVTDWLAGDLDANPRWLTRLATMPVERPGSLVARVTGFPSLFPRPFPFTANEMGMLGGVIGIADLDDSATPELETLAPELRSAFNDVLNVIEAQRVELPALFDQLVATPVRAAQKLLPALFDPLGLAGRSNSMILSVAPGDVRARIRELADSADLETQLAKLTGQPMLPVTEVRENRTSTPPTTPAAGSRHRAVAACLHLLAPFDQKHDGAGWWFNKGVDLDCGADIRIRPALSGWKTATLAEPPSGESSTAVPDWCAEVLLPGSAALVWQQKLPLYVRRGVGWIWLIDPDLEQITAFRVHAGRAIWMGSVRDTEASTLGPFEAP